MKRLTSFTIPLCFFVAFAARAWSQQAGSSPAPAIVLTDVTHDSGIDFIHTDGSYGKYFLIESMSAGLALLDFDLDGDLDIYFLNGARIPAEAPSGQAASDARETPSPCNALYRNDGGFHFTDITQQAGVGDQGMGLGVACADFDNDGFPDIYVNNYGPNRLYLNQGDGTFADVTLSAGVGNGNRVGGGVAFFDMDSDGDLDLYVGNYIRFDAAKHQVHIHKGLPAYPSPMSYEPELDTLFANNGDGTFRDVSEVSGIHAVAGRSMGLVAFDYDGDRDQDVVIANDTQANFLFENDGLGNFQEVGLLAGIAYDFRGKPQASMGVDLLDFNRDGLLDLYFTSFSEEFATCYENLDEGLFADVTLRIGASAATFPHVTWGIVAEDLDNDGACDVFIAAGDLDDQREMRGGKSTATSFRIPNVVLRGNPPKMSDMGSDWGDASQIRQSTRGVVAADLNGDGRVDVVTLNARAQPSVLRNDGPVSGWLEVELIGIRGTRSGIGAVVSVQQANASWTDVVRCGHSYQSDSSARLHFGLGDAEQPIQVAVRWPSGAVQQVLELKPNQRVTIVER